MALTSSYRSSGATPLISANGATSNQKAEPATRATTTTDAGSRGVTKCIAMEKLHAKKAATTAARHETSLERRAHSYAPPATTAVMAMRRGIGVSADRIPMNPIIRTKAVRARISTRLV